MIEHKKMKRHHYDAVFNNITGMFNVSILDGKDSLVCSFPAEESRLYELIEERKKCLLDECTQRIKLADAELKKRRNDSTKVDGKTLQEALAIQKYRSEEPLLEILEEKKSIHAISTPLSSHLRKTRLS